MDVKADYLIALIGTNPSPAFFTILKNCHCSSRVYLVYTTGTIDNIGSENIAKNLANVLKKKIEGIQIRDINCDKSDLKRIDEAINKIISEVIQDSNKNQCVNPQKLLLDYSSGTKAMSALFCNRLFDRNIDGVETAISYLDDNNAEIIENKKHESSSSRCSIREIVNSLNIGIEDITKIHGYSLISKVLTENKLTKGGNKIQIMVSNEKIYFKNENGNDISVDSIAFFDGKLILCYNSKKGRRKEEYKKELFKIKDFAEKLGGSRSKFVFKCDYRKSNDLKKDVSGAYEYEMDKRLDIISDNRSFMDYVNKIIKYC